MQNQEFLVVLKHPAFEATLFFALKPSFILSTLGLSFLYLRQALQTASNPYEFLQECF